MAIHRNGSIAPKREILLQKDLDFCDAIFQALTENSVNLLRGNQIAVLNFMSEGCLIFFVDLIDIILNEQQFRRIKRLEIGVENPSGHLLVELMPRIVALL